MDLLPEAWTRLTGSPVRGGELGRGGGRVLRWLEVGDGRAIVTGRGRRACTTTVPAIAPATMDLPLGP
jgi:hypothetical protein